MEVGLLWYDGNPKTSLEDKVGMAARRYKDKFDKWPNVCHVNPKMGNSCQVGNIEVKTNPTVLEFHLWIGYADN